MDTRSRILDAALACFVKAGYAQTTIERIRERSGASNGALFHHFPTKEAIAAALYADAIASFQHGHRRYPPRQHPPWLCAHTRLSGSLGRDSPCDRPPGATSGAGSSHRRCCIVTWSSSPMVVLSAAAADPIPTASA
jgi:Bacterial regulatory proteins, tetR family